MTKGFWSVEFKVLNGETLADVDGEQEHEMMTVKSNSYFDDPEDIGHDQFCRNRNRFHQILCPDWWIFISGLKNSI
jgi:hypothetical protein